MNIIEAFSEIYNDGKREWESVEPYVSIEAAKVMHDFFKAHKGIAIMGDGIYVLDEYVKADTGRATMISGWVKYGKTNDRPEESGNKGKGE